MLMSCFRLALAAGLAVLIGAANGPANAGLQNNALTLNGLANNALTVNGLSNNSLSLNGLLNNALAANALAANALTLNGLTNNALSTTGSELDNLNGVSVEAVALPPSIHQ